MTEKKGTTTLLREINELAKELDVAYIDAVLEIGKNPGYNSETLRVLAFRQIGDLLNKYRDLVTEYNILLNEPVTVGFDRLAEAFKQGEKATHEDK